MQDSGMKALLRVCRINPWQDVERGSGLIRKEPTNHDGQGRHSYKEERRLSEHVQVGNAEREPTTNLTLFCPIWL